MSNQNGYIPRLSTVSGRILRSEDVIDSEITAVYWGPNQPTGRTADQTRPTNGFFGLDYDQNTFIAPGNDASLGIYVAPESWLPTKTVAKIPTVFRFLGAVGNSSPSSDVITALATAGLPSAFSSVSTETLYYSDSYFVDDSQNFIAHLGPPSGTALYCNIINVVFYGLTFISGLSSASSIAWSEDDPYGSQAYFQSVYSLFPSHQTICCRDVGLEAQYDSNFTDSSVPYSEGFMSGLLARMADYGFSAGPEVDYRTATAGSIFEIASSVI